MRKEKHNSIDDFLNDKSFKNWVLNKETTDDYWDSWVQENPDQFDVFNKAQHIILGINFKNDTVPQQKIDAEWNKLESKLKVIQEKEKKTKYTTKKRIQQLSIAASVIVLLSIGALIYRQFSPIVHKTSYGEVLEFTLEDGTSITLNSNSKISYYRNEIRKIKLEGEAYFNVKKEKATNAKFWVNTNDLTVEVFGTQFNVNTHRNKTKVYLEEGNIKLALDNGSSKKMIPGNYIEYSSVNKKIIVDRNINSNEEPASWKDGKLIFDNYTLEKALNRISDTYGVSFSYKDKETRQKLITGVVPTTDLNICLNAIKKSTNVNIKKENSILVVSKN
ncbi:FecR family protein [Tenacibaculum agarivorans]|uniref:FecR family protein n=1 Tax=Tenacibaculum agarivorans TaxID=1908389 RepID=UPI00094B8CC5|nr:FecR domain-containing protein [Tenacibaculum agarivorans]